MSKEGGMRAVIRVSPVPHRSFWKNRSNESLSAGDTALYLWQSPANTLQWILLWKEGVMEQKRQPFPDNDTDSNAFFAQLRDYLSVLWGEGKPSGGGGGIDEEVEVVDREISWEEGVPVTELKFKDVVKLPNGRQGTVSDISIGRTETTIGINHGSPNTFPNDTTVSRRIN
jgi:hypothetical protein